MPWQLAMAPAIASPIFGSKPYSAVHVGVSITPSALMNSCTLMDAIPVPPAGPAWPRRLAPTSSVLPRAAHGDLEVEDRGAVDRLERRHAQAVGRLDPADRD